MTNTVAKTIGYQVDVTALPDPVGANFISLNRADEDFMMQVGWLNIAQIVNIMSATDVPPNVLLHPKITHQFLMTRSGFELLYRQVHKFATELEQQGSFDPKKVLGT